MKKRLLLFLILTLLLITLTACTEIPYTEETNSVLHVLSLSGSDESGSSDSQSGTVRTAIPNKYRQRKFDLTPRSFHWDNGNIPRPIEAGENFMVTVNVTAPQHYRISIDAQATSDLAIISLSSGGVAFGTFYISGENRQRFEEFSMDNIYLPEGGNSLTFTALRGSATINRITVTDSEPVSDNRYENIQRLNTPVPSREAAAVFEYLTSCFGNRILTAQHCTPNTNAEIEAVEAVTGRYPAIRFGDLGIYSQGYTGDKDNNREIELAKEWHSQGGIVAFTWSWYPRYAGFTLNNAANNEAVLEAIIEDIDEIAINLRRLTEQNIPVLWNPLPDGGSGLYWWGMSSGEDYVWLWRLMFERMTYFHGLDNLIWVWSGGDYKYYPGDKLVDIIAESVFKEAGATSGISAYGSEAVRFGYTANYGNIIFPVNKLAAVTRSSGLPAPDVFARDNTWWLFWGLYRGDFIMDDFGTVHADKLEILDRFYNHELTVCLDELPDVNNFHRIP